MDLGKSYTKLLKKMYLIELLGELLYKELGLKEKDGELKEIYLRLGKNEQQLSNYIEQNIINRPSLFMQNVVINLATFTFKIVPNKLLSHALENILKKMMYSRWFQIYNTCNPELWRLLIEHERLQHDLLSPYWNRLKTGGRNG